MIDFLSCSRQRNDWFVLIGRFCRRTRFRLRSCAIEMASNAEKEGYAYGDHCCGAQYENDKQNLDHHRDSGYQIEERRL